MDIEEFAENDGVYQLRELMIERIEEHDESESEDAVAAIAALESADTMEQLCDAVAELAELNDDLDLDPQAIFESDEVQDPIRVAAEDAARAHDSDTLTYQVYRRHLTYTVHVDRRVRCCGQYRKATSTIVPTQCGNCGELHWAADRTVELNAPGDVADLLEAVEEIHAEQLESHEAGVRRASATVFQDAFYACMDAIDEEETVEEAEGSIESFITNWSGHWDWERYDIDLTEREWENLVTDVDHRLATDAELQARVEERIAELTAAAG